MVTADHLPNALSTATVPKFPGGGGGGTDPGGPGGGGGGIGGPQLGGGGGAGGPQLRGGSGGGAGGGAEFPDETDDKSCAVFAFEGGDEA